MNAHWQKYVHKLASLEEIAGVIWAARELGRVLPIAEVEALERRIVSLTSPRTQEQAREVELALRQVQTENANVDG